VSRFIVNVTWDEVPHLSDKEKKDLWKDIPAYQRRARSKGIPVLGSGVIYPFDEERVMIEPFELPRHFPRVFGLDTDAGAGWTAMVFCAWDRQNNIVYIYRDYKSDSRVLASHVEELSNQGQRLAKHKPLWIPGVGDCAARMVTEEDSIQVIEAYRNKGVDIDLPDKAVEAGIQDVYDLIEGRRLRVFNTCRDWFSEFRQYHRKTNKNGTVEIVKKNDHLMDATRYAIHSGLQRASVAPQAPDETPRVLTYDQGSQGTGWLGM
jgi:phage terminase large subunit